MTDTISIPIVAYGFEFDNKIKNKKLHKDISLCKSIDGLPVYCSILLITSDINEIYYNIRRNEANNENLFQLVESIISFPSREYYIKNDSMIRTVCKWQIVYWNQNNLYDFDVDYESDDN
jgi:hypothetical protein